ARHRVRGDRDDRDRAQRGIALELSCDGVTVHAGQLNVEQDQIRLHARGHFQAERSGLRLQYLVAALLQQEPREVAVLLVVLDEQASRFQGSPLTSSGNVTVNVLPLPHSLSTPIRPPMSSASLRQIASPRPVPSCLRASPLSSCWNGSNRRSR